MFLTVRIERARQLTLRSAGNLSIACAVDQATITTTFIDFIDKAGDKTKYKHNHDTQAVIITARMMSRQDLTTGESRWPWLG